VDPLADVPHSVGLTPYHYAANDPINNIDPDGRDWYRNDESGEEYWQEGDGEVEGSTHIGANHVIEGANGRIYHEQNEVVAYERTTEDPSSGAGTTIAGAMVITGGLVADDATVIGIADDVAIPFILGGAALISGYQYMTGPSALTPSFNDTYFLGFKKISTDAAADAAAQDWGYRDAHDLKDAHGVGSQYDIYRDGKTGKGELRPKKGRPGEHKPVYEGQ